MSDTSDEHEGPVRVDWWQSPRNREFYWHAIGANGGVIADGGEGFKSLGSLRHSIALNYGEEIITQEIQPPGPSD